MQAISVQAGALRNLWLRNDYHLRESVHGKSVVIKDREVKAAFFDKGVPA